MRRLLILALIISISQIFHVKCEESEHGILLEDLIVDYVNGLYFDENTFDVSINYNSDRQNTIKVRMDIINDLPKDIFLKIDVWGRAFGQYKVPTGISLNVNICDGKLKKFFLDYILQSVGVDVSECPPRQGIYENNDFYPDISGLPIYALPGFHTLADIEVYGTGNLSLIKVRCYHHII